MALQVYELRDPDEREDWIAGVVIIDTSTGEPLQIPRAEFNECEDSVVEARAFAAWLMWQDGSWLDDYRGLAARVRAWHRIRSWRKCDGAQCEHRLLPAHEGTLCDDCAEDEAVA